LWDLSSYEGVTLILGEADKKKYTLILKDEILPPSKNGREQSTISYEYDFNFEEGATVNDAVTIFIPWNHLKATYRGKEKKDAPKLDVKYIKRFSIMMRR
jgi:Complex I intermediate-associated protein 30 (CIA30)